MLSNNLVLVDTSVWVPALRKLIYSLYLEEILEVSVFIEPASEQIHVPMFNLE